MPSLPSLPTSFLVLAALGLGVILNALAPRRWPLVLIPSFFTSWLTTELAPWVLFWHVVVIVGFVGAGALAEPVGWIGLGLAAFSAGALVAVIAVTRRTAVTVRDAIAELEIEPDAPQFPWTHVAFPVLMQHRAGVARTGNVVYAEVDGKRLRLDVYRPVDPLAGHALRPGVLQIHGGAWVFGDKREQGIPLLNHLAANGWVGVNANYRLSPRVGFPTHLVDLKRAIAWYRAHAIDHGADPDFLCVTGGSAGGHLSALLALSANDPEYQPGFEDVDTSVRAAVPFYGIYDFTNRLGSWHPNAVKRFFEPVVMKKRMADDPDAFAKASPVDLVHADAPPFFVIHGSRDTLAPVEDARYFVERLREVSRAPVLYAEMQGAQHAFDVFPSFRTARVIEGVERFLHTVHEAYRRGRTEDEVGEGELFEPVAEGA